LGLGKRMVLWYDKAYIEAVSHCSMLVSESVGVEEQWNQFTISKGWGWHAYYISESKQVHDVEAPDTYTVMNSQIYSATKMRQGNLLLRMRKGVRHFPSLTSHLKRGSIV